MKTNYVLIDYENVAVESVPLPSDEHFQWWVFLGKTNTRLPVSLVVPMQELRERGVYITLTSGGRNALDFHIAYYLGRLAGVDPAGCFHVISKDTGFDPLIQHLKAKGISVARSISVEAMPCFAGRKESRPLPRKRTDDELFDLVVADLQRRKTARPRRSRTLLTTIHATCGKDVAAGKIESVYNALVKRGYVKVEGAKVTYDLPS